MIEFIKEILVKIVIIVITIIYSMYAGLSTIVDSITPSDIALIRFSTCALPCWNDITPGETNSNKAIAILNESHGVISDTIKHYSGGAKDHIGWRMTNNQLGYIELSSDIVIRISINGHFRLREVIELYGVPDQVVIVPYQHPIYYGLLIYRQKGILLYSKLTQNEDSVVFKPSTIIDTIEFANSSTIDQIMTDMVEWYLVDIKKSKEAIFQTWNGYGQVPIIR